MAKPFCVIGDPISHSISPVIHKAAFTALGIHADYEAVHVTPQALASFVAEARREGRLGFNVTIPHKEAIIPFLDDLDSTARHIGAVNTVCREDDRLVGYNTDVYGAMSALRRAAFKGPGRTLLLGAGGAARACLEALVRLGVTECVLYDIDPDRSYALKSHFTDLYPNLIIQVVDSTEPLENILSSTILVVNATPVGMWPEVEKTPLTRLECLPSQAMVFDVVYIPLETRLLREAHAAGLRTVSGLDMLVEQALEADALFLKRPLPEGLFRHVYPIARRAVETMIR